MQPFDVSIRDETIKLGQFIKLANLVETGGQAKDAIADSQVTVNRGKTLREGDVVGFGGQSARVVRATAEELDYFDEATADDDFDPEKWRNM